MTSLSKMIKTIGDDKVQFQMLDTCIDGATLKKGYTQVKFSTQQLNPVDLINKKGKVGIIVWFEREDFDKFVKENIK